jgi:hypothetical protein
VNDGLDVADREIGERHGLAFAGGRGFVKVRI